MQRLLEIRRNAHGLQSQFFRQKSPFRSGFWPSLSQFSIVKVDMAFPMSILQTISNPVEENTIKLMIDYYLRSTTIYIFVYI